jgi:endonuclease/exonuclease/phosphatase family metal-dependent hydrolase
VNHWPSRSGGRLESDDNREAAALTLRKVTDSLFALNRKARILIMGDFNDEPGDESLSGQLCTVMDLRKPVEGILYNLSKAPVGEDFRGTIKYRGEWSIFDQIIVSGGLLGKKGLHVSPDGYRIFGASFLLVPDEQYNGKRPNRTYNGMRYAGGFSDHLPVYMDLYSE